MVRGDRFFHQGLGGNGFFVGSGPALLKARRVKQLVHDRLEPIAILAGGEEQIGLLRREWPDRPFGAQVDGHAHRREGCSELVRDGGHEVVLELVES